MLMNLILRKTRITGLTKSEDDITLHLLVLTQYRRVTDRNTVTNTALSIAVRCKN